LILWYLYHIFDTIVISYFDYIFENQLHDHFIPVNIICMSPSQFRCVLVLIIFNSIQLIKQQILGKGEILVNLDELTIMVC